jgi:hypothetical protein
MSCTCARGIITPQDSNNWCCGVIMPLAQVHDMRLRSTGSDMRGCYSQRVTDAATPYVFVATVVVGVVGAVHPDYVYVFA